MDPIWDYLIEGLLPNDPKEASKLRTKLGLSVLDLLGRSVDSVRWTPLQKQETKRIGGGLSVAASMPKSVLFGGREDRLLRE